MKAAELDQLANNLWGLYGQAGLDWFRDLPESLSTYASRWSLKILPPFKPLSFNYVAPAVRPDGSQVVLKLCFPTNPEVAAEAAALRTFGGQGAVHLLAAHLEGGALLLERAEPGEMLLHLQDDAQATSAAVQVMKTLWKPVPAAHPFPTIERWSQGLNRLRLEFAGRTGPFPPRLVEMAEEIFAHYLPAMDDPRLLHGDLHHYNILSAAREPWLAIDPKGVVGEPAYETGALLRNPYPALLQQNAPQKVLSRRASQLAEELGFDLQRILGWATAQAVLAAWWSYADNGQGVEWFLAAAEILAGLFQSA